MRENARENAHTGRATSSVRRRQIVLLAGIVLLVVGIGLFIWHRRATSQQRSTIHSVLPTTAKPVETSMPGMAMSSDGTVLLTSQEIRDFGITFGTVALRPLVAGTRATGIVTVDETRVAQVTPHVSGFAERLYANFTGQSVRRGAPLLEIYAPELVAAQQELLLARQLRQESPRDVPGATGDPAALMTAARRRLAQWDVSEGQIDELLRTGRVRRTVTLVSPVSGVIVDKAVVRGQSVTAGIPLYTIADLSTVWVDVTIREVDANAVRVGSSARLEFAAYPGAIVTGRVSYLYPLLDTMARAVRARVTVANPGGRIKPGMYATVQLATPAQVALTVPSSAVLRTGSRDVVFVDLGHGRIAPKVVEIGRSAGEVTEVMSGLSAGQRVVTSAQFLLDSEANLAEVMQSMLSQTGPGR